METDEIILNPQAQVFAEKLDNIYSEEPGLNKEAYPILTPMVDTPEKIGLCLPAMKQLCLQFTDNISICDQNIKTWQENKKIWKNKEEQLVSFAEEILRTNNINKVKTPDGLQLSQTTRKVLETNDEALLQPYMEQIQNFIRTLPEYVKISVAIDKTKLANHVKSDMTLLITRPEDVHWKDQTTTRIK